jgi:glycosyltransferase involved in cell wall biosynthesis
MILRWALSRADAVLAVSESQRSELLDLGVAPAAISVIQNGSDLRPNRDLREKLRADFGLRPADVVALLVGRLEPQKRVDVFIRALGKARGQDVGIVGLVAGQGPDLNQLRAQAWAQGVDVRFLGRRDDMSDVFALADVLCLTSDVEASPYVLIEAMACGLPVVATRVGGVPEMVLDNDTGLLAERGDVGSVSKALQRLAVSRSERTRMGENAARRYQEHFTADVMADAYADELLRVAAASHRTP